MKKKKKKTFFKKPQLRNMTVLTESDRNALR